SRSLLGRAQRGDGEAWRRLVSLYAPLVYHWCRRRHVPEQDIADVFQDVFQSAAAHIVTFRHTQPGDTFRGWLRTITSHKVVDYFRRQSREPRGAGGTEAHLRWAQVEDAAADGVAGPSDDGADGEAALEADLLARALEEIRGEFHDRTWRAFWRVVVDGLTPAEAGQELAMRPGTVRVAKSRVLHRLRLELGDLGRG
ncbi:MAG TPA: RNA polymerase sigma factor, partial [Planctomycetaceae bacterium]|nr:RNA polymerase sigma factor [Planctomycetaceae bacterium]